MRNFNENKLFIVFRCRPEQVVLAALEEWQLIRINPPLRWEWGETFIRAFPCMTVDFPSREEDSIRPRRVEK